jgi:hypothetical protein
VAHGAGRDRVYAGQGMFLPVLAGPVLAGPGFEPGKASPTVLQTPDVTALTCANVIAKSCLGTYWT